MKTCLTQCFLSNRLPYNKYYIDKYTVNFDVFNVSPNIFVICIRCHNIIIPTHSHSLQLLKKKRIKKFC